MKCPKCHKEIPDESKFCMWCGATARPKHKPKSRGNGSGSIYRRNGGYVAVQTLGYYIGKDGKLHRKTRSKYGFRTKKDAEKYLLEVANGKKRERGKVSYYWDQYAATSLKKVSAGRQKAYESAYKRMVGLHNKDITNLSLEDLQVAVDSVGDTYYTCKYAQTVLSKIYTEAMREQVVYQNLAQHIVLPKKNEKEATPFTQEEIAKLWQAYGDGDIFQGYILLMIYTGMMPGELFGLTKNMVDLDAQMIVGAGLKTSTRKAAPIMLADVIVPVLARLMEESKDLNVCPYEKSRFYKLYHKATKRAGVRDLPPYSCRHTTATALAMATQDPEAIKAFMRHANIQTTQRYIHLGKEKLLETANELGKKAESN